MSNNHSSGKSIPKEIINVFKKSEEMLTEDARALAGHIDTKVYEEYMGAQCGITYNLNGSDYERFMSLYKSIGVYVDCNNRRCSDAPLSISVYVDGNNKKTGRVKGYTGFFTVIEFDEKGRFINQGIWE